MNKTVTKIGIAILCVGMLAFSSVAFAKENAKTNHRILVERDASGTQPQLVHPLIQPLTTGGVPVLLYHQIRTVNDTRLTPADDGPTVVYIDTFRAQMKWLRDNRYTTLSLNQLLDVINGRKSVPSKAVVIMFDDTWSSQLDAIAVLDRYQFKALFAVLVTPEWVDGPYMTWDQVIKLDAHRRYEIVSHSMTHPSMVTLFEQQNWYEIDHQFAASRAILEELVNRPLSSWVWPYGEYNLDLIEWAQYYYTNLFTVNAGLNNATTSPLEIYRSTIDGRCSLTVFRQVVASGAEIFCGP